MCDWMFIVFQLIEYNDTKDEADMTKYNSLSTAWNIYDLDKMFWTNLSAVSDKEHNTVTLQASYKTYTDLWQKNGTFSIQVKD